VIGRDLVLKSSFLQKYVSSAYGRYTYSYTILPGIFSYLTSYLKKIGPSLLEARPVARQYLQHHYTLTGIHTPGQKARMVTKWNAQRYPVFRRNLAYNLAMREQLVALCEQRGVPYLDFNQKLAIPSADFHDLSHLVESERVLWQKRLVEELVTLLDSGADGQGDLL